MSDWAHDAIFYHIYPLGLCGAPHHNNFSDPARPRLAAIAQWIEHFKTLRVNALYLGPLFESTAHGYDTADYYWVDRRLGDNETLAQLVSALHENGIRVILDGVFHHVGRNFWAFRDLQANGEASAYRDWFVGVDFSRRSPYGDAFAYEGWSGHYDLVKLNLRHPEVRAHLFGAVRQWVEQFKIDGLRLDVAEIIDPDFLTELARFCRDLDPQFWLLGEVIHGDYRRWVNPSMLDSVTNYECYKGLYSSLNDRNYFEIGYALNRQFGPNGIYQHQPLYAFADNHDVNRVAGTLHNSAHLYPLYALLFTMPGVPSIYYGSEWGITGAKQGNDDWALRPQINLSEMSNNAAQPDLPAAIARFAQIRHEQIALRRGSYQQLLVAHEQLAFARQYGDQYVVVVLNAANTPAQIRVPVAAPNGATFVDSLEPQRRFTVSGGQLPIDSVPASWARILVQR